MRSSNSKVKKKEEVVAITDLILGITANQDQHHASSLKVQGLPHSQVITLHTHTHIYIYINKVTKLFSFYVKTRQCYLVFSLFFCCCHYYIISTTKVTRTSLWNTYPSINLCQIADIVRFYIESFRRIRKYQVKKLSMSMCVCLFNHYLIPLLLPFCFNCLRSFFNHFYSSLFWNVWVIWLPDLKWKSKRILTCNHHNLFFLLLYHLVLFFFIHV